MKLNLKIGDSVVVRQGVKEPNLEEFEIGGWQGRVLEIDTSSDTDNVLITIEWDSLTLIQIPSDYIEQSEINRLDWSIMILYDSDLEKSIPRDKIGNVKKAKDKLSEKYYWASLPANYTFPTSATRLKEFMDWIEEQINLGLLEITEWNQLGTALNEAWTNKYITDSYKRGIMRATGGVSMSMMVPLHLETVGILYTRVFSELKGITSAMEQQIARVLSQGLIDGDGAVLLGKKLLSAINGTGMGDLAITDTLGRYIPAARRAEMLARTEITRAHHVSKINEYKNWGLEGVTVLAEFITAGDDGVCSKCEKLEQGGPYTLDEAMGMIPVHPNCRCICLPYEEGFDTLIKPRI